jgi:hypothetical protein
MSEELMLRGNVSHARHCDDNDPFCRKKPDGGQVNRGA